ncbi:SusD-like protein P25 [subsurface metagenome]
MKNKVIYILILAAFIFTQCSEDFIDLQPVSKIGEGDFYKTEEEIGNAVVAAYNSLQRTTYTEYLVTEFRSDNATYNPLFSITREAGQYDLDLFKISAENEEVNEYYTAVYRSISACNTVLKYSDVVADEATRKHLEGEVKFIRALNYFNLVRLFGPVFLMTERISSSEANAMQRSPESVVYDTIIADLTDAATNIIDENYTPDDAGRVTSWAAKTLLTKVYLTLNTHDDLLKAESLLLDIKNNSGHALELNYADVFDDNNEMNNEIIFAIRFKSNVGGLGNHLTTAFAPLNSQNAVVIGGGRGYNYPATELAFTYETNDTRRTTCVKTSYIDESGSEVVGNYTGKYISTQSTEYDSEADWPVLRFSDVLLMYAEVLNELDKPDLALENLNLVHARAGLDTILIGDPIVSTKHEFRLTIEKERKLEFAFENHRWFDLVRTDRVIPVMEVHFKVDLEYSLITGVVIPDKIEEWQILLPIPQSQIDINPAFSQNFGY